MFGLVVHANIVSMILDEDPIDTIPEWLKYAIAFLVCIFTVALFIGSISIFQCGLMRYR